MTGEALPAEHNGDIWSREATKHGAILTGKIQRFLLGVSIKSGTSFPADAPGGQSAFYEAYNGKRMQTEGEKPSACVLFYPFYPFIAAFFSAPRRSRPALRPERRPGRRSRACAAPADGPASNR